MCYLKEKQLFGRVNGMQGRAWVNQSVESYIPEIPLQLSTITNALRSMTILVEKCF